MDRVISALKWVSCIYACFPHLRAASLSRIFNRAELNFTEICAPIRNPISHAMCAGPPPPIAKERTSGFAGGHLLPASPPPHQVFRRFTPFGEFEFEAGVEQTAGNDTAALEHQFGFSAQKECG
jgi:hypothetical protein